MNFFKSKQAYQLATAFLIGGAVGLISLNILNTNDSYVEPLESSNLMQKSYNSSVIKAAPAVVNIYTEQFINSSARGRSNKNNSIFGRNRSNKSSSLGSGVIFSSNGYILTNQHVI